MPGQVGPGRAQHEQAVPLEPLLALVVLAVLLRVEVPVRPLAVLPALAVVLEDQSGLAVQQVGDPEEPTEPVVDPRVEQGGRRVEPQDVRQPEAGLAGAAGPDAREGPKAFAEKRAPVWSNPE